MRRVVATVAVALAAGPFTAAAAAEPPLLAETAATRFPDRTYALTLPDARALAADDVEVRENGRLLRDVTVTPADGAAARRFGVVLAIDTSYSMRGRPLRSAVSAAREFVRHRSAAQPVALIVFSGTVDVALPFTTDQAAIERALAGIRQGGGGSRLIDAAQRAVDLIRSARMTSGSAVILSDGADRDSAVALDEVAAAASDAGARIYGVGLASDSEDFGVLNLLAVRTGAEFSSVASPTDLARVYRRLGSRLGHQYIIDYRSAAAPGRRVNVRVHVRGFSGTTGTSYVAPAAPRSASPPYHHRPADRIWLSPVVAVVVALAVAGLLLLVLWAALRPRGGGIRDRMTAYVGAGDDAKPPGVAEQTASRVLSGAERSLKARASWDRLGEALDIGRVDMSPARLVAWTGLATATLVLLLPIATGATVLAVLALAVPLGAWRVVKSRVAKQRSSFTDQMPDTLHIIASAMRAGHSFGGALAVVVEDASEPTRRELQRVVTDDRLGVPIESALGAAARRMASKDLEQVALVAALQRETGGNTAEIVDRVTETVRERLALRRMVNALTAQGRMSRWVLTAIPIFLLGFVTVVNPEYVSPLYTTGIGKALLVVSAVMITSGSLVIKRIVDIEV